MVNLTHNYFYFATTKIVRNLALSSFPFSPSGIVPLRFTIPEGEKGTILPVLPATTL
jgi:hypothetical protein